MIKNRIVKLDKDSQERIDAKNTIKYTLLLDYQVPEYDDDRFINNIFSKCNECCFGLFYDKKNIISLTEESVPFLAHLVIP